MLLYYSSSEIESTLTVYWNGIAIEAAGMFCTDFVIWEFPFLRGCCLRAGGGEGIVYVNV